MNLNAKEKRSRKRYTNRLGISRGGRCGEKMFRVVPDGRHLSKRIDRLLGKLKRVRKKTKVKKK